MGLKLTKKKEFSPVDPLATDFVRAVPVEVTLNVCLLEECFIELSFSLDNFIFNGQRFSPCFSCVQELECFNF